VGTEVYKILGALIMNKTQNYENKTRCERGYLFRTRMKSQKITNLKADK
jgi:hypothetical protein